MSRVRILAMLTMLVGCAFLVAQDGEKLKSGPKANSFLPAPFESFNVNGPAKGRPHCLVCRFSLSPAVIIFTTDVEGKDEAFNDLLKQLDETATDFEDRDFSVGVIVLSADARDSTNSPEAKKAKAKFEEAIKELEPEKTRAKSAFEEATKTIKEKFTEAEKLKDADERKKALENLDKEQQEARKPLDKVLKQESDEYVRLGDVLNKERESRKKLIEGLEKRAKDFKHVIVACHLPPGPDKYDINPKAELTILFYERLKVLENYTFAPGKLDGKDVDRIVKRVRDELPLRKKVEEKKG